MIVMYTSQGCSSCRKAKKYLRDNNLSFIEKDITRDELNEDEIRYLLKRTSNGTDDIISARSKIIRESNVDLEEMNMSELVDFILSNPTVLKRPIILDDKEMQAGYDEDEISIFKKNNVKKLNLAL
ncbi:MAG: transcriptional regulator Spx [Erysipelotrichaceae bacterium]|nr:transcriptional regulator Spx [Erysipelotrichaceae bacterium]